MSVLTQEYDCQAHSRLSTMSTLRLILFYLPLGLQGATTLTNRLAVLSGAVEQSLTTSIGL
jgi:hypothetical protein